MTSPSECLWREHNKMPLDELFDRLIKLIQTERDDIIDENIWDQEFESIKKRFFENESLRRFIIDLRDNPPSTTNAVIERLINHTEDLSD